MIQQYKYGGGAGGKQKIARLQFTASLVPADALAILDCGAWDSTFGDILNSNHSVKTLDKDPYSKADIISDITRIPCEDNSFDCVCALEILEHLTIPDSIKAMREIARVSRHYLLISVPNQELPLGPDHLQWFDKHKLKTLLAQNLSYPFTIYSFGNRNRIRCQYIRFGEFPLVSNRCIIAACDKLTRWHLIPYRLAYDKTHHWLIALVTLGK